MTQRYLDGFPIITDQMTEGELRVILRELAKVVQKNIKGDVVELGCYEGTTALFEARLLKERAPDKKLWLYDSFEGLPPKDHKDESPAGTAFVAGALRATKKTLIANFKKANLPSPIITKCWFKDLSVEEMPERICFAFLDGDYYQSIKDSLRVVWPRMSKGGVILVDDYTNEKLPGAARAVDEFVQLHGLALQVEQSLAILKLS